MNLVVPTANQQDCFIQPLKKPILYSTCDEPAGQWCCDNGTRLTSRFPGQHPAGYWFKTHCTVGDCRDGIKRR